MLLQSVEIKNYRSLEFVNLSGISLTNVLIGRNNSGKSSVFGTLQYLSRVLHGREILSWDRILTNRDPNRALEIHLSFQPTTTEREEFINLAVRYGFPEVGKQALLDSPFARKIDFYFKSQTGNSQNLHLQETKIFSADSEGKYATIQRLTGNNNVSNPQVDVVVLEGLANEVKEANFTFSELNIESSRFKTNTQIQVGQPINFGRELTQWPYTKLRNYFGNSFFFDPFRHSVDIQAVTEVGNLSQDGLNLPQVLHTLHNNDRPTFEQIEKFMKEALPDVGVLHTPLFGTNTGVNFRIPHGNFNVRIYDMGGGIEQLLMVATVLLTTSDDHPIFLEEPESHLHAGAQRFLLERLTSGNRQVFITTHSPVFINTSPTKSMYEVSYSNGKSQIEKVKDAEGLETVLEDIGARNSDVLLSDAVLFVEGNGDRDTLTEIGKTVGLNLEEHNITILPMGGGAYAERGAPIRSDLLEGISKKAPVPHMFVIDRDERNPKEIKKLETQLGKDKIFILKARELENYLLIPKALLNALCIKSQNDPIKNAKIKSTTVEQVESLIKNTAENLYGLVLLKRIKNRLGGLPEGLLKREAIVHLIKNAHSKNLARLIKHEITSRFDKHIKQLKVETVVKSEKEMLDKEWKNNEYRLLIVPGEELINNVFKHFGFTYNKPSDTVLIAKFLEKSDVNPEIEEILKNAIKVSKTT